MINENQMGHGAIKLNPFHRFIHRTFKRRSFSKLGKGVGIDWSVGYDVRNTIGSIGIKNQANNDSCSGQAGSYFIEIQRRLQKINEGALSAKSIYSPIAYSGGGTTVSALEKQISSLGANSELTVPSNDAYGNPLTESMMEDMSWQTPQLKQDALTRAGYVPFDVTVDIDAVAQVIQDWGACIMEISGQNNGTWTSSTPLPPSTNNTNEIWHHFMCLIGFTMIDGKKYIIGLQSMGLSWGNQGIQLFGEDYFNSGYIVDTFTFCYDKRLVPNSDNFSWYAMLLRWFRMTWGLSTPLPSTS